jgi:hypothetical protein
MASEHNIKMTALPLQLNLKSEISMIEITKATQEYILLLHLRILEHSEQKALLVQTTEQTDNNKLVIIYFNKKGKL